MAESILRDPTILKHPARHLIRAIQHRDETEALRLIDVAVVPLDASQHTSDINWPDPKCAGATSLHLAVRYKMITVVRHLIAHGARLDMEDDRGHTPFLEAVSHGHIEITALLLDEGASLECRDQAGRSPLYLAIESFNGSLALFLLERGASTSAPAIAPAIAGALVKSGERRPREAGSLLYYAAGEGLFLVSSFFSCFFVSFLSSFVLPITDTYYCDTPNYAAVHALGDVAAKLVALGADPHEAISTELYPEGPTTPLKLLAEKGIAIPGVERRA